MATQIIAYPRKGAKLTLIDFYIVTQIERGSPLISNLHVKFESDWTRTVVSIVPTRQSMIDGQTHTPIHQATHERLHYNTHSNPVTREINDGRG